jgi:hypothetical protein
LALRLADNQQWPFPRQLPTNSINPSLTILFNNSPSTILFPSAIFPSAISLQPTPQPPSNSLLLSKSLPSSFSKCFISSGKQGCRAAVLGERHDIVTGETCLKQLRKSS